MKKFIFALFAYLCFSFFPVAVTKVNAGYVNGYYKSNGTYVNGYYRSRSNAYTYDNYSYTSPRYSNGYGYNTGYKTRNIPSNWYVPSYYDTDYEYGRSYNYNDLYY